MSATWLSIQVELVEGHGEDLWPRPGRVMVAARRHTFAELATGIDDAFARWDRAHLHQFWLADGARIGEPDPEEDDETLFDATRLILGRVKPGEQFVYEFDFGDCWRHLCTVAARRVDPLEVLGIVPDKPLPSWGWGDIPDQCRRRWADDERQAQRPPDPKGTDLPPIGPWQWRRQGR